MISCSCVYHLLRCLLDPPLSSSFPLSPFPASHFALLSLNVDFQGQYQSSSALLRSYLDILSLLQSSYLRFLLIILIIVQFYVQTADTSTLWKVLETEKWKSTKRISTVLQDTLDTRHWNKGGDRPPLLCIFMQISLGHLAIPLPHSSHFHTGLRWARVPDSPLYILS